MKSESGAPSVMLAAPNWEGHSNWLMPLDGAQYTR